MLCITQYAFYLVGLVCLYVFAGNVHFAHALTPSSKTSKALFTIYQSHPKTFFCEALFSERGEILFRHCQHCSPIKIIIGWMPIVSLEELAQHFPCYHHKTCINKHGVSFKGLRCCSQSNEGFRKMKEDLFNLVPELPVLIAQRRHKRFFSHQPILESRSSSKKICQLTIDKKNKWIDPSPAIKGMIARTYLYMKNQYGLSLHPDEYQFYLHWHQKYPLTNWERERCLKIEEIQGITNPYCS